MMGNTLIGVAAGVFVGALAVEILNRTKPGLTKQLERKAKNAVDAFVTALRGGSGGEDDETESMQPEQSPT